MATPLRDQERAKEDLPELKALPGGWLICVDGNKRVCFRSDQGQQTFVHPTFGSLPKPWILRYCRNQSGNQVVRYYNNDNKMSSTQNPRHNEKVLRKQNNSRKEDPLGTAAGFHKMKKGISLDKYKREPVGNRDIRHRYDILKALDLGTGQLGGMNGGVFVVKMKGQERLSVEKRSVNFWNSSLDPTNMDSYQFQDLQNPKSTSVNGKFICFIG
jgi:NIMA (never in mitosis gene a)-related kinase